MASSLRKRLGKRQATPEGRRPTSDRDGSSGGSTSSLENVNSQLTQKGEQTIARDDLTTTPPPPSRKSRSSTETQSRKESPSQTLLDRYKKRAAKAFVSTESPTKDSEVRERDKLGKGTAFSEHFDEEPQATLSQWVDVPETPEHAAQKDTRMYGGVEFEMMGKKAKAGERPVSKDDEDDFVYARRTTRSHSRRQSRADSHDSNSNAKSSGKSDSLVPPGLSIRKIERDSSRTPSPRTDARNTGRTPGEVALTSANSPRYSRNSSVSPQPPTPRLADPSKSTIPLASLSSSSNAVAGVPTFSIPQRRELSDPLAPLSSLTSLPSPFSIPVNPPRFDPSIAHGYQWTSHLSSTSRPLEPWGLLKAWICCKCEHLDPFGRNKPAQTMVEQKICARLACGHERCAYGCRMLKDPKFDSPGVFQT